MKSLLSFAVSCAMLALVLLLSSVPLSAQKGCVNSPENPTAILALAGSAGAGLRLWLAARKKNN